MSKWICNVKLYGVLAHVYVYVYVCASPVCISMFKTYSAFLIFVIE